MKMLTGEFVGYTEETREYTDKNDGQRKSFQSRKFHLFDGGGSEQVELGRDFCDSHPNRGDQVTLEVVPRVSNSRLYWTALRVLDAKAPAKSA